jgi:hypothetical protein
MLEKLVNSIVTKQKLRLSKIHQIPEEKSIFSSNVPNANFGSKKFQESTVSNASVALSSVSSVEELHVKGKCVLGLDIRKKIRYECIEYFF